MLKRTDALADMDAGCKNVAEFVEEWWRVYAGPNLERATLRVYANLWNGHALPRLGHLQLRELSAGHRALPRRAGGGRRRHRGDPQDDDDAPGRPAARGEWGRVPTNAVKAHAQAARSRTGPRFRRSRRRSSSGCAPGCWREDRLRDATLLVVLAYAGLRPQEALALEWRHVRERTLLVERALSDGKIKALKNRRQPRTVPLLAPLREDLAVWRRACGVPRSVGPRSSRTRPRSPSGGRSDWRNWRKRSYRPVAEDVGVDGARPYVLRHAFASLLIHEGRLSVVDIAAQLGHNPTVCLDTYAHVMAEQRGAEPISAEEQIARARSQLASGRPEDAQLSFDAL